MGGFRRCKRRRAAGLREADDRRHRRVPVRACVLGKIAVGSQARVQPEEPATEPRNAKVTVVDRVVDAASGTYRVRLELPNSKQSLPAGLKCVVTFIP